MNLREMFAVFMTGNTKANDLLGLVTKAMERAQELPIWSQFQSTQKRVGTGMALKGVFIGQKGDGDIGLENRVYDYYLRPDGFQTMIQNLGDCGGKSVLTACLLQGSGHGLQYGNVIEDGFAKHMIKTYGPNMSASYLREMVYYELPHGVIVINGEQFDPLSVILPAGIEIEHRIQAMDLKVGILGGCAVNFCSANLDDLKQVLYLLQEVFDLGDRQDAFVARNIIGKLCDLDCNIPDDLLAVAGKQVSLEVMITRAIFQPELADQLLQAITARYGRHLVDYLHTEPDLFRAFQMAFGG
jgi:hypothetical protein